MQVQNLVREVLAGNKRGVARAITLVENDDPMKSALLQALYPHTGSAYIVGITGSPGAGKSSLVDQLIHHLRQRDQQVGVLAVDPSSPFTGGAILGDRVRMNRHAADPKVYIRSMGTRGSLGGLARSTREVLRILDASGCRVILLETVGVGQSELDVMAVADTCVVVLTPGAGDVVQAFKAGIMEIADLFVINKADLPGAGKLFAEVEGMLDVSRPHASWRPPVLKAISREGTGTAEIWEAVERHRHYLQESGLLERKRQERVVEEVLDTATALLKQRLSSLLESRRQEVAGRIREQQADPYAVAEEVVQSMLGPLAVQNDE